MERNCKAPLSPNELASLRGLRANTRRPIPGTHREVLLPMGLVNAAGDELNLSNVGYSRLESEEGSGMRELVKNQPPTVELGVARGR